MVEVAGQPRRGDGLRERTSSHDSVGRPLLPRGRQTGGVPARTIVLVYGSTNNIWETTNDCCSPKECKHRNVPVHNVDSVGMVTSAAYISY